MSPEACGNPSSSTSWLCDPEQVTSPKLQALHLSPGDGRIQTGMRLSATVSVPQERMTYPRGQGMEERLHRSLREGGHCGGSRGELCISQSSPHTSPLLAKALSTSGQGQPCQGPPPGHLVGKTSCLRGSCLGRKYTQRGLGSQACGLAPLPGRGQKTEVLLEAGRERGGWAPPGQTDSSPQRGWEASDR